MSISQPHGLKHLKDALDEHDADEAWTWTDYETKAEQDYMFSIMLHQLKHNRLFFEDRTAAGAVNAMADLYPAHEEKIRALLSERMEAKLAKLAKKEAQKKAREEKRKAAVRLYIYN